MKLSSHFRRAAVLGLSLLLAAQHNPRFHLHFLQEEMLLHEYQFVGIEQQNVLLCKCHTDYNLSGSYQEIVVDEPSFLKQYVDFYLHLLLPRHTYSEAQSIALLREIRDAR